MGRKKKRAASRIWCYYCDREFEDEKILVQHQKAKHFKCHFCQKKLSTAAGMSIHVLQVHKETVSKVPNAIDGRESTDIEIYGMQGIPADAKAAHVGEEGETALSKILKVDLPSPQVVGAVVSGPIAIQYPLSMNHPVYNPAAPLAPAGWPVPPHPQPWFTHHSATSVPPPGSLGLVQQPLFPVQNLQSPLPSTAPPGIQPSISNGPPGLHPSMPLVAVSQPLFPVVSNSGVLEYSSTFSAPTLSTSVPPNPSEISSSIPLPTSTNLSLSNSYQGILHSYASEPNTDGPSIGPPPMIANKAPQPAIYEVYLIWEDEAMSMEERRMSLKKYLDSL